MKVSDNKEEVEKQADFEIISTNEIQKSAKLAGEGHFREAQAQAHITRKYLLQNREISNFSFALNFKGIETGKLLISSLCKFSKLILKEFIFLVNNLKVSFLFEQLLISLF